MSRLSLTELALVTGNPHKLAEASRIVGVSLERVDIDLPEIQSMDYEEILHAKADEAWRRVGRPVAVEETGLELPALNGFPGPLVKWMLESVGPDGVAEAAITMGDPQAIARCQILVRDGDETIFAEGTCEGTLVLPPRGESGFGWDSVFVPNGYDRTSAELGDEVKDRIGHRGRAWRALMKRLG